MFYLIVYSHVHKPFKTNCNRFFACGFIAHSFIGMLSLKAQPSNALILTLWPDKTLLLQKIDMHSPHPCDVNLRYSCRNCTPASVNSILKFWPQEIHICVQVKETQPWMLQNCFGLTISQENRSLLWLNDLMLSHFSHPLTVCRHFVSTRMEVVTSVHLGAWISFLPA